MVKAFQRVRTREWVVLLELSVVTEGRGHQTGITTRVSTTGIDERGAFNDERGALLALVQSGKDAARLWEEDAQERWAPASGAAFGLIF